MFPPNYFTPSKRASPDRSSDRVRDNLLRRSAGGRDLRSALLRTFKPPITTPFSTSRRTCSRPTISVGSTRPSLVPPRRSI